MAKAEIWLRGMAAAVISGGANGAITGFAAIGIDPSHFNLAAGFGHTLSLAGVSSIMSAIIGVAAYLKQSPLPCDPGSGDSDGGTWQHPERQPTQTNVRMTGDPAEAPAAWATTAVTMPTPAAAAWTAQTTARTSMRAGARWNVSAGHWRRPFGRPHGQRWRDRLVEHGYDIGASDVANVRGGA